MKTISSGSRGRKRTAPGSNRLRTRHYLIVSRLLTRQARAAIGRPDYSSTSPTVWPQVYKVSPEGYRHLPQGFLRREKLILTHPTGAGTPPSAHAGTGTTGNPSSPRQSIIRQLGTTGFQSFPLSNFKYCLTLFSKFFSSFPHGTCSLSVSRQYLALEGIYLPISAAIPSNATLRKGVVR